eukprot:1180499-Prorocentrum_minimum.AAC.4
MRPRYFARYGRKRSRSGDEDVEGVACGGQQALQEAAALVGPHGLVAVALLRQQQQQLQQARQRHLLRLLREALHQPLQGGGFKVRGGWGQSQDRSQGGSIGPSVVTLVSLVSLGNETIK